MLTRMRPLGAWGAGMGSLKGTDVVSSIAAAITQMEGYIAPNAQYPNGSLAYQNQNPGNIRWNPNGYNYPGATPGAGGFAKYPDLATGQAALNHQIQVQIDSGQNLTQFFNQYAPSSENNTANYIAFVAQQTGIDPSVPLQQYQSGAVSPGDQVASASPTTDSTGSSITDLIANTDPVVLGGVGLAALGLLWVMFGRG